MKSITEKELELIFPETEVDIAGHTFTITPFNFVETKIVADKLKNVLHLLGGDITIDIIAEIYSVAFDGIRDVIAMSLSIDKKLVEKFDQKSASLAIINIIKINKDFFIQEVQEEVMAVLNLDEDLPLEK